MEFNLQPQKADATVYEGEGGGYYSWTSQLVADAAVGAGKFLLRPRGFALPHYCNCNKIGYVIQGSCTVGLILPNKPQEKIIIINKGDAVLVPIGTISWWFNGGDSDVTMVFLGETSQSYTPGQFDYFLMTGANGILNGFSSEFITSIFGLHQAQSRELVASQPGPLIISIGSNIQIPTHPNCEKEDFVIHLDALVSNSGTSAIITSEDSPLVGELGLSPRLVRLEPEKVLEPYYSMGHQLMYVMKGKGKVEIVGFNGVNVLSESVEEGHLIVVPRFFVSALGAFACQQDFEFLCVSTSPRASSSIEIAGNSISAFKALSSSVLEAALNVTPQFVKTFKSKY